MTFDRFKAPSSNDDRADCAGCQRTLHYESLDSEGFCDECRAEWPDDDVKNCESGAHGSALLRRLQNHRAAMAPHQKERLAGKLLLAATDEIDRLIGICTHVHDGMLRGNDDMTLIRKLQEGWQGPNDPDQRPGRYTLNMLLREQVRAAIDAEPELPGEMPKEIWDMLRSDERAAAEVMRANLRAMKVNIKVRLGL